VGSRRDLIEAEDFQRRRAVAALTRGDTLEVEEVPRRPNAWLIAGVVLALLIAAGSAVTAFITDRVPDGWMDDGSLVVDEDTGARYVAMGGILRPTPTLTGALLAGARGKPVLVSNDNVQQAPLGRPLTGAGMPERPPDLPAVPTGFTTCVTDAGNLEVFAGEPATLPSRANGVLVSPIGLPEIVLVSGRRAHPVSDDALTALGYSSAQVREVPAAWLALAAPGPPLTLLEPMTDSGLGVPGVGAASEIVASAETGRHFLVADGTVQRLVNRTSELLAPSPVRTLPGSALRAAPPGTPYGIIDAPTSPPVVSPREAVVVPCVRSSDGLLTVASDIDIGDARTRPGPTHEVSVAGNPTTVRWHFPPGEGALVGPLDLDRPRSPGESATGGTEEIRLVAAGIGHPVASPEVLRALGYRREQTVLLPDSWLALLEPGVPLAEPS